MKKSLFLHHVHIMALVAFVHERRNKPYPFPTHPVLQRVQAIKYSFVDGTSPAEDITIHVKAVSGSIVNYSKDNSASILCAVYHTYHTSILAPWYFVGINLNVSDPCTCGVTSYPVTAVGLRLLGAGRT